MSVDGLSKMARFSQNLWRVFDIKRLAFIALPFCTNACDDDATADIASSGTSGGSTASATGSSSENDTSESSGTVCVAGGPPCAVCPDALAQLCGLPCTGEETCLEPSGAGASCVEGVWQCVAPAPGTPDGCPACVTEDTACTEIGCTDSTGLAIVPDGAFVAGEYHVEIAFGDTIIDCAVTFDSAGEPSTEAGADTCTAEGATVRADGVTFRTTTIAAEISARVTLGENILTEDTYATSYAIVRPNGEGCPPACAVSADIEVTLAEIARNGLTEYDNFVFGSFFGRCLPPGCVETFMVEGGAVYQLLNGSHPGPAAASTDWEPHPSATLADLEPVLAAFPAELFAQPSGSFGCPDCADQGGFLVELTRDGDVQRWLIDTDDTPEAPYLEPYKTILRQTILELSP